MPAGGEPVFLKTARPYLDSGHAAANDEEFPMKRTKTVVFCLGLVLIGTALTSLPRTIKILPSQDQLQNAGVSDAGRMRVVESYGKLPLSFEPNQGQTDSRVRFLSRGSGYALFLTANEAVLALRQARILDIRPQDSDVRSQKSGLTSWTERIGSSLFRSPGPSLVTRHSPLLPSLQSAKSVEETAILRMKLLGGNPAAPAKALEQLPGRSNYFIGNDPKQWRTNVPNYGKVRFAGVYPGVDLVYYGNQSQLEYDFVVAPGADPSAVTLGFAGAKRLEIGAQGDLALQTPAGEVRWHKPVVYQEIGGVRQTVDGQYVRKGKEAVGFEIASYDPHHALVIDPTLDYSTYLGGSGSEAGRAIAVDSAGSVYVTGSTSSISNMTTVGAFQTAFAGGCQNAVVPVDAFVAKFDTTGFGFATRIYSTYLGGNCTDGGAGIAVDSRGNAYVAGATGSLNFPALNAYQAAFQGGPGGNDAFVTKLNAAGDVLLYSTYLGGTINDGALGIAVDSSDPPNGYAYVTGRTTSTNFPTLNGFSGSGFSFVTKLNTNQSGVPSLVYSSYLGSVFANGIAADSSGKVYVTGSVICDSSGWWAEPPPCGTSGNSSVSLMKIDTNTSGISSLVYARFLNAGPDQSSVGNAIAVDSAVPPNVYVTGSTNSFIFPGASSSPIQNQKSGGTDAFVAKLNGTGDALVYSTYLGGIGTDQGFGIAVDALGNAYVTGTTASANFPLMNSFQSNLYGTSDAFVTKVNASGTDLSYSTYLGGNDGGVVTGLAENGRGIAVDSSGNAYVIGDTLSTDFPTVNAFQFAPGGGSDAFVAKISDDALASPAISLSPTSLNFTATAGGANPADQAVVISNSGGGTLNWNANVVTGASWLGVSPSAGTDTGTLTASVNIVGLAANTYNGSIQVDGTGATNTPQTIPVQLTVTAPPPPSDTTPPVLSLPANITVNATDASGAVVTYTASATDAVEGSVPVTCIPPSSSTFPIGTTTVNCSASDSQGNTANGSFTVTVKGSTAQIADLINLVSNLNLPNGIATSLITKLDQALVFAAVKTAGACGKLNDFIAEVTAKTGRGISAADAAQLIASATQIKAVLGCP